MTQSFSALQVGTVWSRLSGLMDEIAEAFLRTSFSLVVRENWDMAMSLLDADGRQFLQSSKSIPSFLGTMPRTLQAMLAKIPKESLKPGDVLISNDSWIGTGHLNDITMIKPLFRDGRLEAFIGGVFHTVDIGGAPSPEARDAYEEGITIPISRVMRAGVENEDIVALIEANVRSPAETLGDIRALFAAFRVAEERLFRVLDEEAIPRLAAFVDEILARSEASMRAVIRAIPDGIYRDRMLVDGLEAPLEIACAVTIAGESLTVDYAGTSAQVARPINSVMNYTYAYTCYALKCALDPKAPNNDGSLRPITVKAPEGCLVNPRRPAPVWGRHMSGHYLPFIVYSALSQVIPERVVADCGSPLWNVYFKGQDRAGQPFVKMFFMNGGHGARPNADGPGVLSFPSNVATTSIEQFESAVPMLVTEKALIPGSGGAGKYRGGAGQRLSFKSLSTAPIQMTIRHERVKFPPRGLLGGEPGRAGRDYVNGERIAPWSRTSLRPGDVATFETPGGGGLGPFGARDPAHEANVHAAGLLGDAAEAKP